ncbi:tumor protein p53-inducible protein 11-like isoform X1 [Myxocyprinus asiaticus]|uniref:tumor protein p53-inducible protein 11-like isoform X1 n=1 Tax=Myxocyprinus asiaticus TaxID=70543 RepID=UPI002223EB76|nr:tumor protein p53-inducible protein 11-like isoform X1 [Myxocyprinus asiaticus]XP_051516890.1 tumor protein p53-inducible protein 11-like isoform X1 [Myxocyprinus asiaticus]
MSSTPPPLMKKHSQMDLVSRLKSRKVLGVGGEDDDGEVHRSKEIGAALALLEIASQERFKDGQRWTGLLERLWFNSAHWHVQQHSTIISCPDRSTCISQMLGNEIKFAVREPIGLRLWILTSAVLFTSTSLMALAFPNQLYEIIFELTTTRISIRLYGGALLCISLILWNGLYTAEKVIIQWTLLTEACYFGVQFLVTFITLLEMGTLSNSAIGLLLSEAFFLLITLSYYRHLGRRPKKI